MKRGTRHNHAKSLTPLIALSALLVGLGALIAPGHLATFFATGLVLNLGAYFFSDRLILHSQGARPGSPSIPAPPSVSDGSSG